jgi:hypothetical protein
MHEIQIGCTAVYRLFLVGLYVYGGGWLRGVDANYAGIVANALAATASAATVPGPSRPTAIAKSILSLGKGCLPVCSKSKG